MVHSMMTAESNKSRTHRNDIDHGWAWVCLIACYFGAVILCIMTFSGGIINLALLKEYSGSNTMTALIGTMNAGLSNTLAPIASVVANISTCRVSLMLCAVIGTAAYVSSSFVDSLDLLLITYGILGGIGFAFGCNFVVVVGYYFEKRRNFLMGILHAMYSVGMVISAPLSLYLVDTFGLRCSFMIMGAVTFHLCIIATLCKPSSIERELLSKRRRQEESVLFCYFRGFKNAFQFSILKNGPFVLFLISIMSWTALKSVCLVHLPNYMSIKGSTSSEIGIQMSVFTISNLIGRLLAAAAIGAESIDAMTLHIGMMGVAGVSTLTFPFYSNLTGGDVIFAVVTGLYTGGPNAMMTSITVGYVGVDKLAASSGLTYCFSGVGYMIGGPIAGFSYGMTKKYDNSFYIAGAINLVGCLLAMLSVSLRGSKQTEGILCKKDHSVEVKIIPESEIDHKPNLNGEHMITQIKGWHVNYSNGTHDRNLERVDEEQECFIPKQPMIDQSM